MVPGVRTNSPVPRVMLTGSGMIEIGTVSTDGPAQGKKGKSKNHGGH
jgi:hypothetical protein